MRFLRVIVGLVFFPLILFATALLTAFGFEVLPRRKDELYEEANHRQMIAGVDDQDDDDKRRRFSIDLTDVQCFRALDVAYGKQKFDPSKESCSAWEIRKRTEKLIQNRQR